MTVLIEREAGRLPGIPYRKILEKVAAAVLEAEGCPVKAEVDILLTDDASIRSINRETRGIDAPTDVLSFPAVDWPAPADYSMLERSPELFHPETGDLLLGDMVISLEKVTAQAAAYGHSQTRELAFLAAHSMFHLLGYDHMEESGRLIMEAKQEQVLQALGITRGRPGERHG